MTVVYAIECLAQAIIIFMDKFDQVYGQKTTLIVCYLGYFLMFIIQLICYQLLFKTRKDGQIVSFAF